MMTLLFALLAVCVTVLALALFKGDVSAALKLFGLSLVLEAKDRKHR